MTITPAAEDAQPEPRHVPKRARSRATLERLVLASTRVLEKEGRDQFTTAQVDLLAGVSIGSLYRYFSDWTAILDHIWPHRESGYMPTAHSQ